MKRSISLLLALLVSLTLAACGPSGSESASLSGAESQTGDSSIQQGSGAASSQPAASESDGQDGESSQPEQDALPYLLKVARADQMIFDAPGYDYGYVGTVKQSGTYTIVEEAQDGEGNLWGRLKSGAGWIDLTDVAAFERDKTPVSVGYARDAQLPEGVYHQYATQADPQWLVGIVIRAYDRLEQVSFTALQWNEDDYEVSEQLYTLPELTPDCPLVAEVDFPGDMTTYGLFFTDSSGEQHRFTISQSGRNGTLVLEEIPF